MRRRWSAGWCTLTRCFCSDCQQTRAVVRSWAAYGYEPEPHRARWFLVGVVTGLAVAVVLAFAAPGPRPPRQGTTILPGAPCDDVMGNPSTQPESPGIAL